jgi:GntR family transcriptional regulator/MocR family aminotransferase
VVLSKEPLLQEFPGPLSARLLAALRTGTFGVGDRLPSTRALAADLGVSRGVVVRAYEQLASDGYLLLRRGAAPLVAAVPRDAPAQQLPDVPVAYATHNLRPDLPDLALFPRGDWLRASRVVLERAADTDLAYGEPFGAAELRHALAGFLARTRGVTAAPSRVGVHAGSTQALSVLALALRDLGARRIGVEWPSHRWRRAALEATGIDVVPFEDDLAGFDAVVVSPTNRYPFARAMSAEQRRSLVDWAVREDALVIEHDYDGHFRYDGPPASALQALAPEHVAYVGTASALLAPTLRIGWSVLPERLCAPVAGRMATATFATNRLTQLTLAETIARGYLDRQLRRTRAAYRRKHARASAILGVPSPQRGLYVHLPASIVPDERIAVDSGPWGVAVGVAAASDAGLRALAKMTR